MNRETARAEIRGRLTEYVEQITEKSKGKNMYICPLCQSGTGKNRTGAFSIDPKDPAKWRCFACGAGGDIFDLVSLKENLTDYNSQLARLSTLFGVSVDRESGAQIAAAKVQHRTEPPKQTAQPQDYTAFFAEAQAHITDTDYWSKRGLSLETVKRFGLGYVSNWKHPDRPNMYPSARLIIPTGRGSYIARATDPETKNRYINVGATDLFEAVGDTESCRRIYIVEGAIDAMSIAEAGGRAIALNSVSNWRKLAEQIAPNGIYKEIHHQLPVIIIALDNDAKGEETAALLADALTNREKPLYPVPCVRYNPSGDYKDPNEALVKDREGFINAVKYGITAPPDTLNSVNERKAYMKTSALHHLQAFINGISESANTPPTSTGFKNLDKLLDGGLYEGLYFIGAISSLGKTTLVMQIADQIAQNGRDVLIFSLEMARSELMAKSISRHTMELTLKSGGDTRNAKTARGITDGARYAGYSSEEHLLISEAISEYSKYADKVFISEGVGDIGWRQIRDTVEKHIKYTGAVPVVIIDYLQITEPEDIRATDKQNTDKAVLELKRMSRDYKIPVIGISSFNRVNYKTKVSMESFKESGAIEYSSDVLIGLQLEGTGETNFDVNEAKARDPRTVEFVILKNRNGQTGGKTVFNYYPKFNLFTEA